MNTTLEEAHQKYLKDREEVLKQLHSEKITAEVANKTLKELAIAFGALVWRSRPTKKSTDIS